jgi:hypothetical protein
MPAPRPDTNSGTVRRARMNARFDRRAIMAPGGGGWPGPVVEQVSVAFARSLHTVTASAVPTMESDSYPAPSLILPGCLVRRRLEVVHVPVPPTTPFLSAANTQRTGGSCLHASVTRVDNHSGDANAAALIFEAATMPMHARIKRMYHANVSLCQ